MNLTDDISLSDHTRSGPLTQCSSRGKTVRKISEKKAQTEYINCCDDKVMISCLRYSGIMKQWHNVLVFSVVVLINIASINCIASRQVEGM
jgi:hypothetical protein